MQIFTMQRGTGGGVGMGLERRRTAMDCITNTHDTSARTNTPRKRRLSETVHISFIIMLTIDSHKHPYKTIRPKTSSLLLDITIKKCIQRKYRLHRPNPLIHAPKRLPRHPRTYL